MNDKTIHAAAAFVAEMLGVPQDAIGPDSSMDNTPAWDSMEHMTMMLEFERRFGTSLDLDKVFTTLSVRDLAALVP